MEYVADELGVPLLRLPVLQRELSPRRGPGGDPRPAPDHPAAAPGRPPHAHRQGRRDRAACRLSSAARGRGRIVHTYHGHVLSGYFSRRWERVFRSIERPLARTTGTLVAVSDEVRDDLVGFGVAPARALRRRPVRLRPAAVGRGGRRGAARDANRARRRRRHVRRRLGRPADGDQASARPDPHAARAPRRGRRRAARARRRRRGPRRVEALAAELAVADRCRLVGFQKSIRPWYAAFDALLLTSANEGTPVVAIEALAAARPVVATRAGGTGDRRQRRRERLPRGDRRHGRAGGAARPSSPRDPELRGADGRARRRGRARAFRGRADGRRGRGDLPPAARVKVLHLHKLTGVSGSEGHLLALLPALRERGVDARFLGLDVPGTDAHALLRGARRARRPPPLSPLRLRRQPADGARRRPRGPRRAARPRSTPISCTPTSTADRAARLLGVPSSRRATTTTATCSARSATSTALSPGRHAA